MTDHSVPPHTPGVQPYPQAQPYPHPGPPVPPPRRRGRKAVVWIIVGVVLLGAAGAGAAAFVNSLNRGPTALEVAEAYLQHIADGDAEAALALQAPPVEMAIEVDRTLLSDEVLGAAVERISDVRIENETDLEDAQYSAHVDVSYQLAGERRTGSVSLTQTEGGPFDPGTWEVVSELTSTVSLFTGDDGFLLGGVELAAPAQEASAYIFELFPAVYPIEAVDPTYLETDRDALTITTDLGDVPPIVALQPNDAFRAEVDAQVQAFLAECATQTTWRPEGCPLSAPLDARPVPVTWEVTRAPGVEVVFDGTAFEASDAEIRATYTPEGATDPVVWEDDLTFMGEVELDGGSLSISYD